MDWFWLVVGIVIGAVVALIGALVWLARNFRIPL